MKIVLTGSLGNVSRPLASELVKKGHTVTVISRKTEKKQIIETIGATAAIGDMLDADFLSATFDGADIVYLMETNDMSSFFDPNLDVVEHYIQISNNHKRAIEQSGVSRIIHLSSIGAHTDKGNGILRFHHYAENILKQLPARVSIKFMRPVGFFTNLFRFIQVIKTQGVIFSNYGGDEKDPWVSPLDIASTIVEEIEKPFNGRTIQYIASDEVSPNEIAKILGEAIGIPALRWVVIPDEQLLDGMVATGWNPQTAQGFVEMQAAQGSGRLYEDYRRNRPILGKVKLVDFAQIFANTYGFQHGK